MTMMMIRSRMDLAPRVDQSPEMPSWMAPMMAMAPMQTVRDAVTKPLTKPWSFALPVFLFSHSPKRSKRCSILMISPMSPPKARQMTSSIPPPPGSRS